ncbi:hypothetical protein D3C86_849370 [compost metagenome]
MVSPEELRVGLETQALGCSVSYHFGIRLIVRAFSHLTVGHVLLEPAEVSSGKDVSIITSTHHLVVGRADVQGLACRRVSELVGGTSGMFTDMLVHFTTRHDVEELTTTADARHRLAQPLSNDKVASFLEVTPGTITSGTVILFPIQPRGYVLTTSELHHVSVNEVTNLFPASSLEHLAVATTATTYNIYLRH